MAESYVHKIVNFQTQDDADAESGNTTLSVILDDVSNGGETTFPINSDIFLLVLHSEDYSTDKSAGTLTTAGTGIAYEVVQQIVFAFSDSASLSHVPSGTPTWQWIGDSQGTPSFDGKNISLVSEQTGLLEVTYDVDADRLKLVSATALDIVVVAYQEVGDMRASTTVTVVDATTTIGPYNLTVKDYCSGDVVPSASVWVDDILKGQTNSSGQISLGMLTPGEHQIRFSAVGYLPSDTDHLNNDSFTVSV